MNRLTIVIALTTLLLAGPALAQPQPAPSQQKPAPTPPQAPAPTPPQTPPAAQAPAPQPVPPRPFPEGAKIAFVNIQAVASSSAQGKAFSARIQDLQKKKNDELAEKNKALQAAQQKLQQSASVMSDDARGVLEKDIDRMTRELQFLTQNAQAEVQELQQELQADFQKQLEPIIEKVASARNLYMVFSVADSGLVWADRGLDLTPEIIKEFDAASAKPKTPEPAPARR
jgi:outer membrane protein